MTLQEQYNEVLKRIRSEENYQKYYALNMNLEHTANENKLLIAFCKLQNAIRELEPNTSPKTPTKADWEREGKRWLHKVEECLQIDEWK